jgi:glycolate oxidase FAD binding subunit
VSLEALRGVLGADAVEEHPEASLDGVAVTASVRPSDADALAEALRALSQAGAAAIVRGAGTGLAFGNPPRRADVWLSTERLSDIDVLDADEGVAHAQAGAPLADLRLRAAGAGWDLPIEAPDEAASVGGALARAALGPRVHRFGPPRDHVLGLGVALASGERTRCGGRVVKNVTGYDLAKLHVGGCGTLGVIESAWLRLRPLPETSLLLSAWIDNADAAFRHAARVAELPAVRALALVDPHLAGRVDASGPESGQWLAVAELGGGEPEVKRAREGLGLAGAVEHGPELMARLRAVQNAPPPESGLRFRLVVQPARIAAAAALLARAGAALLSYPGAGFLFAGFPFHEAADSNLVDSAWRAVREAAHAGAGSALLESAPGWAKSAGDVFGEPCEATPLFRALKQQFDPQGILNPGRFAGGL